MASDPYKYFRIEARELLDQLGKGVLALEKGDRSANLVQGQLRLAHTLKGAARVVKQIEISDLAHAMEDKLALFRDLQTPPGRELFDELLKLLDRIQALVLKLGSPPGEEGPEQQAPQQQQEVLRTVWTDVLDMDNMLDAVAETHTLLTGIRQTAPSLARARRLADLLVEQLAVRGGREGGRSTLAVNDKAHPMAEELRGILGQVDQRLSLGVDQMDRELRQVREAAEQLRLAPAEALFTTLERTARDTAHALGKQVTFESSGGTIRLDAHVLGIVQGALLQLIRNAVAHGIESPAQRLSSGKPAAGKVSVEVIKKGRRAVFRCEDDGQGVDIEAVRRVAALKGLPDIQAGGLGADDLMIMLLQGGITTSATVTEVSGRGIGLDVVREAAQRLDGKVTVRTDPGKMTRFELTVPLSLASLEVLTVEAAGVTATIPLDAVRRTLHATSNGITQTSFGESVMYEDAAIPFLRLARVLRAGEAVPKNVSAWSVVVVEGSAGCLAALGVDRLMGTATVVLRPLPELAAADPVISGASIDAEGNPQLVLDPEGLVIEANRESAADKAGGTPAKPVLVIDDSLTTRMLEQSILESAGYEVDLATSGEEAIEVARKKRYALFLVDVEMPGMDGFTFVEQTRLDPEFRHVPAILVTSRASPEDKRRGEAAGASGYMVKSEFDQVELLALIRRLVD